MTKFPCAAGEESFCPRTTTHVDFCKTDLLHLRTVGKLLAMANINDLHQLSVTKPSVHGDLNAVVGNMLYGEQCLQLVIETLAVRVVQSPLNDHRLFDFQFGHVATI